MTSPEMREMCPVCHDARHVPVDGITVQMVPCLRCAEQAFAGLQAENPEPRHSSLSERISPMWWVFPRGDSRRDDVREIAQQVAELEQERDRLREALAAWTANSDEHQADSERLERERDALKAALHELVDALRECGTQMPIAPELLNQRPRVSVAYQNAKAALATNEKDDR